jgi:hypothetical protein
LKVQVFEFCYGDIMFKYLALALFGFALSCPDCPKALAIDEDTTEEISDSVESEEDESFDPSSLESEDDDE